MAQKLTVFCESGRHDNREVLYATDTVWAVCAEGYCQVWRAVGEHNSHLLLYSL